MIEAYVAVVTAAGAIPFGFYLGLRYAAARAELRRPPAPHEALARVYQAADRMLAEINAQVAADVADRLWRTGERV